MKTTVYLIRHAEAAGNIDRTFQGHTDADVTRKGLRQLDCLAERFRAIPFDAIYASPLRRTRDTAQAANRHHGLALQIEPGLIEIDGGDLEGVLWEEIPRRYPKVSDDWDNAPHLYQAPGGESMQQVFDRMAQTVDRLARENAGKTIVVVSHGCALRNYLCHAHGWPIQRLRDLGWEENTAVSLVEYDEACCPRVVYSGDASHLPLEDCTLAHQDWWQATMAK